MFLKESEAEAKVRNLIIDVNNAGIRLEFLLSKSEDILSLFGKEKKPADVPLYLNGQHFELHREKHNDKKSF
ncbi:MAG: hypothetical protein QJQ54_01745 [Mollicutes bacterium]|nr:MAG: hypothetical protein QJQ54_01745 [Mollicutes bacterium]